MAKKQNNMIVLVVVIAIIGFVALFYAQGEFSVIGDSNCEMVQALDESGQPITSYDDLRKEISDFADVTDEEFQEFGLVEQSGGVYQELCKEVVE